MKVTFWGTRGSIPSPGQHTVRYGGNTPCVEVRLDDDSLIIFDAGSGIRLLGNRLAAGKKVVRSSILITHEHWDHIQGLPFFVPAFIPGNEFKIVGTGPNRFSLKMALSNQMRRLYFPVKLKELEARFSFHSVKEEEFEINGASVKTIFVNHPTFALGYRLTHGGRSIVYVSDNEPLDKKTLAQMGTRRSIIKSFVEAHNDPNQRLYDFVRDADLFIHDSFFTPDEYVQHIGWGHSHYLFTLQVAREANVKHCVLFHHHPNRTDDEIDEIVTICRTEITRMNLKMQCSAAAEGQQIVL
ncbi:MAG: MBL fold metallo-hydrolase [Ignavibacteriales bacterium]|nr:MBL fold metallo-hydrolase [Ignavibacteriales bacterium]